MRRPELLPSWSDIVDAATADGITHCGVAPAEILDRARRALLERREQGLHAGMGFTYRNPERSTDPRRAVEDARSILVFAKPYLAEREPERPPGVQARIGRYAWVDHYEPLRRSMRAIAHRIRRAGHRAVAFADDNSIVDREVAYLGGLGWFGKNANILVPGAGSFFVLGSIITTAEYPVGEPVADACGSCERCLTGCPTGAIVAPGVVDANKCLAWLVQQAGTFPHEYREVLGDRLYGCDDCQEVCPPTVRLGARHRVDVDRLARQADETIHGTDGPDGPSGTDGPSGPSGTGGAERADGGVQAWVDVLDLLEADDATLIARHGRWYVADRDPTWWRRTALIVLGNTADPTDERVRVTLDHYRAHPNELLREHADWAAERLAARTS